MTTDLLQYDISMTEILHTTCSKHVVVDGKGLVPCDHHMSTFGCARNTGFKKTQKNNDNLKYLINCTGFSFLI